MKDELRTNDMLMAIGPRPTGRATPRVVLAVAILTALISAALCTGAILAPAPIPAVPFVVSICVGAPLFACWELPVALASLRADRAERSRRNALARLRRTLDRLPETEHPLGL